METIGQPLSLPVAAARRQEFVQTAYELARIPPDELALVVKLARKPMLESGSYAFAFNAVLWFASVAPVSLPARKAKAYDIPCARAASTRQEQRVSIVDCAST